MASGRAPSMAASGGHHDGAEAQQGGLGRSRPRGSAPGRAQRMRAKSIIMMAFFLTMPISSTTPIRAMIENSMLEEQQGQDRADPGRGQGGDAR